MPKLLYSEPDNAVLYDQELSKTAYQLYNVLVDKADRKTKKLYAYVAELAEAISRSVRTTRKLQNQLVKMGIIEIVYRKYANNTRMNLKNLYIIHGRHAKRYENSEYSDSCLKITKMATTSPKMVVTNPVMAIERPKTSANNKRDFLEEIYEKNTLKREAKLPKKSDEESFSQNSFSQDLEGVPDILKTTAEYWLFKTGKKSLSESEIEVLHQLLDKHTPVRIQKEIDTAVERFIRDGKNPAKQNFAYIGKALSSQKSYDPEKKASRKRKEASNAAPEIKAEQAEQKIEVPAPSMTVEEAETVIASYTPNTSEGKKPEHVPAALLELFEKIQAKDREIFEDYLARSKAETERAKKAGEDEREIELRPTHLEDYLNLKFPEAEEEELHRDYSGHIHESYEDFPRGHLLEDAFQIDYACAMCKDPDRCRLPEGYRRNSSTRPVVKMQTNENDEKYLVVDYGDCITCKHASKLKVKTDYELEDRIKHSGLSESQSAKTFDTFDHKNAEPDIVVAKAQAILAAQNKTNLILAGKPVTGKTHLATAIALEAMRNGRKAIFKSLPELLDEICYAFQNNADPQGLMLKYKTVSCLVLDDWGKEKTSEARLDYLYQIIDYRYRKELQTIITTNALNSEGLKNRWNADKIEPLVSRILENGEWVTIMNAENHRLKKSVEPEAQEILEESNPEESPVVDVAPETEAEALVEVKDEIDLESCEEQGGEIETCTEEKGENSEEQVEEIEDSVKRKSWQEIFESAEYQAMSEHDKVVAQWKYIKGSPEYANMSFYDQIALQIEFGKRIDKATQNKAELSSEYFSKQSGYVINVPQHNDGLDELFKDDEDELKLYGAR